MTGKHIQYVQKKMGKGKEPDRPSGHQSKDVVAQKANKSVRKTTVSY